LNDGYASEYWTWYYYAPLNPRSQVWLKFSRQTRRFCSPVGGPHTKPSPALGRQAEKGKLATAHEFGVRRFWPDILPGRQQRFNTRLHPRMPAGHCRCNAVPAVLSRAVVPSIRLVAKNCHVLVRDSRDRPRMDFRIPRPRQSQVSLKSLGGATRVPCSRIVTSFPACSGVKLGG